MDIQNIFVYIRSDFTAISINNEQLNFNFSIPEGLPSNVSRIIYQTYEDKIFYELDGDSSSSLWVDKTEEHWNKWIQPFIALWQDEKDRIEQAEAEAGAEKNKFENRQARALEQLNQDFQVAADRAHVVSSLGFTADANSTANENVNGLLVTIGDGTVQFCDYYNEFHALNKAQLETLQSEIIQNGQNLYAQKWQYRTAIENCTDNEGLDAIVATIEFTYMDFSTAS